MPSTNKTHTQKQTDQKNKCFFLQIPNLYVNYKDEN